MAIIPAYRRMVSVCTIRDGVCSTYWSARYMSAMISDMVLFPIAAPSSHPCSSTSTAAEYMDINIVLILHIEKYIIQR